MSEFMTDMEDWSLQAIVRGPSGDFSKCLSSFSDDDYHYHLHQFDDGEFLPNFPDELEHLYKPFYHPAAADSLADPAPAPAVIEFQEKVSVVLADDKSDHSLETAAVAAAPKYKRRKNLHKREVIQVSADGLAADMWAWRKYGQKPIKGSPYPRSYYRCSSSKGCLARKQVEQSCTDPGMYIITYTAEHSHSQPTRRNSLAGTVRQKFPSSSSKTPYARQSAKPGKPDKSYSPKTIHQCSYSPSDDVIVPFDPRAEIKEESKDEDVARVNDNFGYSGGDDFIMSDFAMNEGFFSGLEEFDEFVSEIQASAQQFPVR